MIYLDCGMGCAGDMLSAALLELCDSPESALLALNRAFAGKAVLTRTPDTKCGISGSHLTVTIDGDVEGESPHHHHHHTSIGEVRALISSLALPDPVIADALAVYDLIAAAEAAAHGAPLENIHFHEVGTLDAMADVVSSSYLLYLLHPDRVCASPVHVGSGTVRCAHGELPVPAPATQALLLGIPTYQTELKGELCTPTGAALLKRFVSEFCPQPPMRVTRVGYGTGHKDFPRANVLRALLGEQEGREEELLELKCSIDDMTAEELAFAQDRLLQAGALDVTFTAIGMKKSRPGTLLTCLCRPSDRDTMLRCLFRHTTTLGVRAFPCARFSLNREIHLKETPYGEVRVKRASGWGVEREKPEFEDLKRIAAARDIPLRHVLDP